MSDYELEPWVIVTEAETGSSLAMWELSESGQAALTLFSSQAFAERYAEKLDGQSSVMKPARQALLSIMIECYQQGVTLAVLDPDQATAKKIFQLADVLRAARQELKRPSP